MPPRQLKPLESEWLDKFLKIPVDPVSQGPQVESRGDGSRLTSPLGNVENYNKQGPALRDPALPFNDQNALLSINEHVQPTGATVRITTDPATGQSPVTQDVHKGMTTLRTTRTTGDEKNVEDEQISKDWDAAKAKAIAEKGTFDPHEDIPPELQAKMGAQAAVERQLAAAKAVGDTSVTSENVLTSVHGQQGDLSAAGKAGQSQATADLLQGTDVDDFVNNNEFMVDRSDLQPQLPRPRATPSTDDGGTGGDPSPADANGSDSSVSTPREAPSTPSAGPDSPPQTVADPVEPTASVSQAAPAPNPVVPAEAPATVSTTAASAADGATAAEASAGTAAADGAMGAEAGVGASAAGAGLLGGLMAGGATMLGDYGKVKSGQMTAGDAAADVGAKTVEGGVLTIGGMAAAKSVASTVAEGGGVVGAVVGAGMALVDDVGKVEGGQMSGGQATADVATKAAVGAVAGAAGAWAGAAAGAEAGAALGTVVPGIGNVVGFVAGAVVGAGVGYLASELTQTETGKEITSAVAGAVDTGIDAVKDAGHAVANFFGGGDDAAPAAQQAPAQDAGAETSSPAPALDPGAETSSPAPAAPSSSDPAANTDASQPAEAEAA